MHTNSISLPGAHAVSRILENKQESDTKHSPSLLWREGRGERLCILLILLIFTAETYACWSPNYTPGEYWTFYAYDKNKQAGIPTTTGQNIAEWQQYTAGKATFGDVRDVVYRYPLECLERTGSKSFSRQDTLYQNSFVKYLVDAKDHEAIKYLILAKKCEIRRALRNDPWWYPTKEDLEYADLRGILDEALAYKGTKLNVRYWLQAIRAAYTIGEYDLCLQLWHDHIERQPASSVRTMCEDYIGGIYFLNGDYETAIRHYANTMQQSSSFWWCVDNMAEVNSDIERIKILYQYCPTSPELAVMVQKICREAEDKANPKVFDGNDSTGNCYGYEECGYAYYLKNRDRYIALRDFALSAASEGRSDNPAMWQYAAAFLTMLDGDATLAMRYITNAGHMKGNTFVKNNIKVLHLMLDAMTGSYDEAFEARILPQLQWLDGMITSNLTNEVRDEYLDWEGSMFANYSSYYFNDMMRKITLSVMALRYFKCGQPVKAMMLTGMASEHMRTVTGYRKNSRRYNPNWNIDFYTDIFRTMDFAPVNEVIAYRDALQQGGNDAFERFLAARCYNHTDYFNELIGTKYMRGEWFDLAVQYLSKVSAGYDTTLNIYEYFWHDPLSEPYLGRKFTDPAPGYKLNFAKRMLALQKKMDVKNKKTKSMAMYQYAVGLMRATNDCWALLYYKNGALYMPDNLEEDNPKMTTHCRELFDQAMTLSRDQELKARCLTARAWISGDDRWNYGEDADGYWRRMTNPASIFTNVYHQLLSLPYANTKISKQLFSECDMFLSYRQEEK